MEEKKFDTTGIVGLQHLISNIFDGIMLRPIGDVIIYTGNNEASNQFCVQVTFPALPETEERNPEEEKVIDYRITMKTEEGSNVPSFSLEYMEVTDDPSENEYSKLF